MKLPRCLQWWRAAAPTRTHRRAVPDWVTAVGDADEQAQDEALLLGCGWFDSSHELHSGLQVTEHLTPERVANEVPLGWWLDWQAGGGRAASVQVAHGRDCQPG